MAVLKAGGAYLPVDPALPRDRQALMLNDAQPVVLITQQTLQADLPPVTATGLCPGSRTDQASKPKATRTFPDA